VLSTASGIVFVGDDSGAFVAADAATGKPLWHFPGSGVWKASPMTYSFDGRQYVAVASGCEHHQLRAVEQQVPRAGRAAAPPPIRTRSACGRLALAVKL